MSIPPDKVQSAIGGLAAGSASGGQNTAAGQVNIGQAAAAQASQAPPGIQMLAHQSLLMLIDSRVTAMIAATKATESKVATFAKKYWPVAAGLGIAATRFIH